MHLAIHRRVCGGRWGWGLAGPKGHRGLSLTKHQEMKLSHRSTTEESPGLWRKKKTGSSWQSPDPQPLTVAPGLSEHFWLSSLQTGPPLTSSPEAQEVHTAVMPEQACSAVKTFRPRKALERISSKTMKEGTL